MQENLMQSMDESVAPFKENETGQSARKKTFALPKSSPSDFFTYILPRLVLSKFQVFSWYGNRDALNHKVYL